MKHLLPLFALLSGMSPLAVAADPAVVTSEFIFETNPVPSCHATTIAETPAGLVAAWFAGTAEGKPDVAVWTARQIDGRWTAPEKVADGAPHPCWNPVLFQPSKGPLLLFYKVGPSPRAWWGMLKSSADEGKTWTAATRLPEGFLGPIKNKPIELASGVLICPSSTESEAKPSAWRAHFEMTPDLGQTWTMAKPASHGEPGIDAIQPSILQPGGENLVALGRTRQKRLFRVESPDLGRTWGAMTLLDLPNPNSGTDALTLKDGRHVLIYNHTERGRSPLNVAVSADGQTWRAALILEDEPKAEFSYPAVIQTRDGMIHFTYTWKRKLAKHVVVNPAKLTLRPIVDGKWPE